MSAAAPRRGLACRLCIRRKAKCDKQIPCHNCVKRETPAECEREDPASDMRLQSSSISGVRNPPDDNTSAAAAVAVLRARAAELEVVLQDKIAETTDVVARSPTRTPATEQRAGGRTVAQVRRSSSPSQGASEIEDAVTVLEFLAWGRMKDPDNAMLSPEALRVSEHDDGMGISSSPAEEELDGALEAGMNHPLLWLQILLSSRRLVYQLADYHSNCMPWPGPKLSTPSTRPSCLRPENALVDHGQARLPRQHGL
ncbi:hypothetical protein AYL99_06038 [Fonsecaea erecta]|uniref:Zn(2)-C6 fungal-type domain-containing protein n=1 Tax=Fonsecaea erecta TaxID=1367422 RepID=A0A178ZMJ5_9EURO|nr:hypothetical protein AYL99_06038 [Fonsecaea erecta]OAP61034.1 hypothetical protein AYL99_06038 [Fonsecaea erecta]